MMTDFWNKWAIEKMNAPIGWTWSKLEVIENHGHRRFDRMEGGIYGTMLKTGPKKGTPNYKKPDPGTHRVFIFPFDEWRHWKKAYLVSQGICEKCEGDGRMLMMINLEGSTFIPCPYGCEKSLTAIIFEKNR